MSSRSRNEVAAWQNYWSSSGHAECVPDSPALAKLLRSCWQDFARQLPRKGRLLDLGTGRGSVLDAISRARPDLRLTGVDYVDLGGLDRNRFTLISGVNFEALPRFPQKFDAVTSQFAFEYAEPEAAARAVADSLGPEGAFQFVIHDRSGPVLTQAGLRRRALSWAVHESGYLEKAIRLATARAMVAIPTPPSFREAIAVAHERFESEPVAVEIMTGVHEILARGERSPPGQVTDELRRLKSTAIHELVVLDALERAACGEREIESIRSHLERAGLAVSWVKKLREPDKGLPFAWIVQGKAVQ